MKEEIAEKYCRFLNLNYKTITVIKEEIKKHNNQVIHQQLL